MSETSSAASESVAPVAAPAESSPPANSQPPISVSEAARLLNAQRRQQAAEVPQATPAPNGAAPPAAAPPAPGGLSAMEKALGLPDGSAPPEIAAPTAEGFALPGEIEIEGQRLRTLAEVQAFAQRKSADYTQKTQELAAERRELQSRQEALATVLPLIQPELARLAEAVQNAPPRPDPRLLDIDPNRYHRERAAWEQGVEEQQRLASITQLQSQAQARAMEQQVAAGNEALAKEFPFWADPQQRLAAQQQIVQWALSKGGFQQQELQGLTSPHHLKAMMKAAMFDRWVDQAKTSAPPGGVQPVRGAVPPPAPSERVAQAQQAFDAKPDWKSGAALLAARRRNGTA